MKLISWNVNGLRSAEVEFIKFINDQQPDVIMIQELRAEPNQLSMFLCQIPDYKKFFNPSGRSGYGGTVLYYKGDLPIENPTNITGEQNLDAEGRTIQFNMGKTIFLNFYVPNGSDLGPRLKYKLDFCKSIIKYTKSLLEKNYSVIIGADMNIAHTEIDLYSPKTNQKSSGFLPACRKIFTELLEVGFVDSFRYFNKGGGFYTWWSFRDPKRKLNQGWRYDYFLVSDNLITKIKRTAILKEVFGSDHCPILLEIEI